MIHQEWQPKTRDMRSENRYGYNVGQNNGSRDNEKAFLQRTGRILGVSTNEVRDIFIAPEEKALRVNPLGFAESVSLSDQLSEVTADLALVSPSIIDWYPRAMAFDAEHTAAIQSSASGRSGKIFIQTPSSYLPVHALLGVRNSSNRPVRVLDLCAAPGGKTALMAAETRRDSRTSIIANDPKARRVQRMREVFSTLLVPPEKVQVYQQDGQYLPQLLGQQFDKILVDAECSTDSGINFSAKNPLAGWSLERVARLTSVQVKLAQAAYDGLKPGGSMVYSTCTLSPEENEGVLARLKAKRPDTIIQPVFFDREATVRKIDKWNGNKYPDDVSRGVLRIFPGGYMDSFSLALIHKPLGSDEVDKPRRDELDLNKIVKEVK